MKRASEAEEMIRTDAIVRKGLGVRPTETIRDAAIRIVRSLRSTLPQRVAAHAILRTGDDASAWERMRAAARILEGRTRSFLA